MRNFAVPHKTTQGGINIIKSTVGSWLGRSDVGSIPAAVHPTYVLRGFSYHQANTEIVRKLNQNLAHLPSEIIIVERCYRVIT